MKNKSASIMSAICAMTVACGSVETIDSKKVPVKPGTTDTLVQDVYQRYSLAYSESTNKTFATAQFRVNSRTGDTIRYTHSDQVKFRGIGLDITDGDQINKSIDVISLILLAPILNIFKTGTFYHAEFHEVASGNFEFQDDYGNKSEIQAKIPEFNLTKPEPSSIDVIAPTSPFVINIQTAEKEAAAKFTCTLISEHHDDQGKLVKTINQAYSSQISDQIQCSFSIAKLQEHKSAVSDPTLTVELALSELKYDKHDRKLALSTSRIWSKILPSKPGT